MYAEMYEISDKHGVVGLKDLAQQKLRLACAQH
jgi:hypothetical protein